MSLKIWPGYRMWHCLTRGLSLLAPGWFRAQMMRISQPKDAHLRGKRCASLGQEICISKARDAHLLKNRPHDFKARDRRVSAVFLWVYPFWGVIQQNCCITPQKLRHHLKHAPCPSPPHIGEVELACRGGDDLECPCGAGTGKVGVNVCSGRQIIC